ncbi:MAG: DUF2878 family protein [Pseudomonadota bacterium]
MERRDWLNLILFKLGWGVAVVGGDPWLLPQLVVIAASLAVVRPSRAVLATVVAVALLGIGRDAALVLAGVLEMGNSVMPVWLALLWVQFALVLQRGMHWMAKLSEPVQVPVGMVSGTLAYAAAVGLGAGSVGGGVGSGAVAWAVIAVSWGALMWLQLKLLTRTRGHRALAL